MERMGTERVTKERERQSVWNRSGFTYFLWFTLVFWYWWDMREKQLDTICALSTTIDLSSKQTFVVVTLALKLKIPLFFRSDSGHFPEWFQNKSGKKRNLLSLQVCSSLIHQLIRRWLIQGGRSREKWIKGREIKGIYFLKWLFTYLMDWFLCQILRPI